MTKCRLSVAILLFAEWRPASCFQLLLVPRARKRSGRDVKSLVKSSPLNGETRVAIVPPSEKGQSWHADAIHHLNEIAIQLDIPFISGSNDSASYSHLLTTVSYPSANSYALGLHANPQQSSRRRTKSNLKLDPMFVDLCPPSNTRLGYRINQKDAAGGEELLLKALGIKKMIADKQLHSDEPLIVYDLTAGLARDSLIIMNACIRNIDDQETPSIKLHMIERDKIVATLVLDAMRRLRLLAKLDAAIPSELNTGHARQLIRSLTMQDGDAIEVLQSMFTDQCKLTSLYPPDICYLDPMFPPRKKKSSAVKKVRARTIKVEWRGLIVISSPMMTRSFTVGHEHFTFTVTNCKQNG